MPRSVGPRFPERLWTRQRSEQGQISLDDDTVHEVLDLGDHTADASVRVAGCHMDVTLNGQGNVDAWIEVAINGTMTQIGDTRNINSSGGIELADFNVGGVITNQHIAVYAQGNQASPTTPGTVDFQTEFSLAGPDKHEV